VSSSENDDDSRFAPIFIIIFVVILWGLNYYLLIDDVKNRGTIGDMFGAVNALFSGLAFAGVVYAIFLQRKELKLQREELSLTRDELKAQRHEFEEQNKTLKKQRFENTFFQMLSLHNDIVNSMDMRKRDNLEVISEGRYVFRSITKKIEDAIRDSKKADSESMGFIVRVYENIYKSQQAHLGHYFRSLYRIIKFIDESDIEDKKFYTDIVRAQLSNQELQLLFYNCLSSLGVKKFKPLVEKYALLNNLPPEIIYDPKSLIKRYAVGAYGDSYPII
jgi:hypothetical protein